MFIYLTFALIIISCLISYRCRCHDKYRLYLQSKIWTKMFGIFLLAFHCIVYPALATSNEHIDTIGKQLSVQADMIKQLGAIVEFQNERLAKLERQDAVIRDQGKKLK